jgi:hypothetical protein
MARRLYGYSNCGERTFIERRLIIEISKHLEISRHYEMQLCIPSLRQYGVFCARLARRFGHCKDFISGITGGTYSFYRGFYDKYTGEIRFLANMGNSYYQTNNTFIAISGNDKETQAGVYLARKLGFPAS